ncbi:MAG: DUF2892 domain-containing protein [Devosia sp.]|nr:DUF2892 domain-containing protein [Devosia sp.]
MLNVGTPDRLVRLVLGIVLVVLPFAAGLGATPWLSWGLILVGAIILATSAFGFCPIYAAFGLSTRRRKQS